MDKSYQYCGVIIEGLSFPLDELYYLIPEHLRNSVSIGKRVLVPFGDNNDLKPGYVLTITNFLPEEAHNQELKEIAEVEEETLFREAVAELIYFVSKTFLVPVHELFNFLYRSAYSSKKNVYVKCIDPLLARSMQEYTKSASKRELLEMLMETQKVSYNSIRKALGKVPYDIISELEKKKVITKTEELSPRKKVKYRFDKSKFHTAIKEFEKDKPILRIIAKFLDARENCLVAPDNFSRMKGWKNILQTLTEKGYLQEVLYDSEISEEKSFSISFIEGGTLKERLELLVTQIQERMKAPEKALIVFPDRVQIELAAKILSPYFGDRIVAWTRESKYDFLKKAQGSSKVILTTGFGLFLDVPGVNLIIVEDASSKHSRAGEFNPFDVRITAVRKCQIEQKPLVFSSYSTDGVLEDLKSIFHGADFEKLRTDAQVTVVDMRKEYKSGNYSMLSSYALKRLREEISQGKNTVLLLNRKPYSTFVMCRECGFVLRCPECKNFLYFDIELKALYCPVCHHREAVMDRCPRCKSIAIHYFGGGIQKLERFVRNSIENAFVSILTSEKGRSQVVTSNSFQSTIFIGTDYIFDHLDMSGVSLFVFVSIDTYFNSNDFDAPFEALRAFSCATSVAEEVIVQSYQPDSTHVNALSLSNNGVLVSEEMRLRKELGYPPYKNLILLRIRGKEELSRELAKSIKDLSPDLDILGPIQVIEQSMRKSYEISIRTDKAPLYVDKIVKEVLKKKGAEYRFFVYPAPRLVLGD